MGDYVQKTMNEEKEIRSSIFCIFNDLDLELPTANDGGSIVSGHQYQGYDYETESDDDDISITNKILKNTSNYRKNNPKAGDVRMNKNYKGFIDYSLSISTMHFSA